MLKKHLATITILVKDRLTISKDVNQLMTEHGHLILARLGVNVNRTCAKNCSAMITLAVEGTAAEINQLNTKLDKLYGVISKKSLMTQ